MNNILLTSAGRRTYLVNYFKNALKGQGKVIVANMYDDAPAMFVGDVAIKTPHSLSDDYIPFIKKICKDHNVSLIFSLHDIDTFALAKAHEQLTSTGALPVIPTLDWATICLDKYLCSQKLSSNGIDSPWTEVCLQRAINAIQSGEISLPVIIKDRLGFGSTGLHTCHSIEELTHFHALATQNAVSRLFNHIPQHESVLIQEHMNGPEYCVDIVNDLNGNYAAHFVCEVHAMRSGETDSVTTRPRSIANDLATKMSALTKHIGIWGVDTILHNGKLYIIDINPRFTGDYPFHQVCGADIPSALLAWHQGKPIMPEWLSPRTDIFAFKDLTPTCAERQ